MSKRDDASNPYKISSSLAVLSKICSICCFALPFIILFFSNDSIGNQVLSIAYCVSLVLFFFIEIIDRQWFFYDAEDLRRKLWIDNSFNSHVTAKKTEGYFNNSIPPSFIRLALDSYENCFFTFEILKRELFSAYIKFVLSVVVLCVVSMCDVNHNIMFTVIQALFSGSILCVCIDSSVACFRLKHIKDIFYNEFFCIGLKEIEQLYILFSCVFDYECLKSYYHLRLNSKTFNKINQKLTQEWTDFLKPMPPINPELLQISFPTSVFSSKSGRYHINISPKS